MDTNTGDVVLLALVFLCSLFAALAALLCWLRLRSLPLALGQSQLEPLDRLRQEVMGQNQRLGDILQLELGRNRDEVARSIEHLRVALSEAVHRQSVRLDEFSARQQDRLDAFQVRIEGLGTAQQQRLLEMSDRLDARLKALGDDNQKQLETMRQTVDEKLQSTLDKRLTESFKHVSERLEQVHVGLGEMKSLAHGVGDLKKVLTNVTTRGTWGEIQLGNLLEQVLVPSQYAENVSPLGNEHRVEFAIRLPGRDDGSDSEVWLPIDAKFPNEDYQRLLAAESHDAAEEAWKGLEARMRASAKDIQQKYVSPPATTDFGIMFLPTEGLFAEVMRRPGLAEDIQQKHRIVIAGPTTLWAILNSLSMGFRTLAIQQRSSEVWQVLAAVKTEWRKYEDVLKKVQKKLQEATNTVDSASQRTRAIGRKLVTVEDMPNTGIAESLLGLDTPDPGHDDDTDSSDSN